MKLSEIATVTGKGGLFKILAPTKSGVILESLDEARTRMIATANNKLSVLSEISIYTTTREGTAALKDVLRKIRDEYGDDIGVDSNSDASELKAFLKSVLPEYDEARVYTSDLKKLVRWYGILQKYAPDVFDEKETEPGAKTEPVDAPAPPEDKSSNEKSSKETSESKEKSKEKKPKKTAK